MTAFTLTALFAAFFSLLLAAAAAFAAHRLDRPDMDAGLRVTLWRLARFAAIARPATGSTGLANAPARPAPKRPPPPSARRPRRPRLRTTPRRRPPCWRAPAPGSRRRIGWP